MWIVFVKIHSLVSAFLFSQWVLHCHEKIFTLPTGQFSRREGDEVDWLGPVYPPPSQEDRCAPLPTVVNIVFSLQQDSSVGEKVMKLIDSGLRTPHLPSRIAVLHGILYLLESAIPDVNKFLIPMTTDFLFRNIATTSQ